MKKILLWIGGILASLFLAFLAVVIFFIAGGVEFTSKRIVNDLDGKVVSVPYGQIWIFDESQKPVITVHSTSKTNGLYVVIVDIDVTTKIPASTKSDTKLPEKVTLSGTAKLTYEFILDRWYLMGVEAVSLRVTGS